MIEFDIPNYRRIDSKLYEKEKRKLLIELVKLQDWIIQEKKKIAVVFEGRDTAGKTGSISVLSKYLIPKHCRLVKLGIPTENESKNCIDKWNCMWCNNTYIENTDIRKLLFVTIKI